MPNFNSGKKRNKHNGGQSPKNSEGKAKGKEDGSQVPGWTRSISHPFGPAAVAGPKEDKELPRAASAPAILGVSVKPKLLKRFYEALAILSILGQSRGEPTDEDELELTAEPEEMDSHKLRRSFTRHLAYLCDYEKGGDRTCAIGLRQTHQGIVYFFASNRAPNTIGGARDRTKDFLNEVLTTLKYSSPNDASAIESTLFIRSVDFSSARIREYSNRLKDPLQYILSHVIEAQMSSDPTFINWLAAIQDALTRLDELCRLCYEARNTDSFRSLGQRARDGAPCATRFETIRHLVGRLNHTMKAVKVIIATRERGPRLFDNFEVVRVCSPAASSPPLQDRNPSLFDIAGRLIGDAKLIERCREDLDVLDKRLELSTHLSQLCTSSTWRPRVHAELILLDRFWTQKLEFVDGDRYIGCSKPACFCCYHYIRAHPGRFVTPACHNNNWINWRPPDIEDSNDTASIKLREDILNEMVKKIRIEVLDQIREQRGPRSRQPDSNTEISSTWFREALISTEVVGEATVDAFSRDEMTDFSYRNSVVGSDCNLDFDDSRGTSGQEEQIRGYEIDRVSESDDDDEGGVSLTTISESAGTAPVMPGSWTI